MASIKAIDSTSVHRLTSGQVIVDLQTAVKELVENALDAGSTSVEIRFKEYGLDSIEVVDNGKGIDEADWPGIALKHHTSKLDSFASLVSLTTLGFRGEALSSLCGTASLSLTTATSETSPVGTSLSFLSSGECVVGSKVARQKGTTVTVQDLFKKLPVRRKELEKNHKREFGKVVELIHAYALVEGGVRIDLKNSVKAKWSTHLSTPLSTSSTLDPLRRNFSSLFSPKSLVQMMDLELELLVSPDKSVLKHSEGGASDTTIRVRGLVSKPVTGNGRTSSSRQYFYINGRPFAPTKISKAFNEVYKSFNIGSFPSVVADFRLPPDAYDVNVSPDKRTIFVHSEGNLIVALKTALEELFQPSRSTFVMGKIGGDTKEKRAKVEDEGAHVSDEEDRPSKRKKVDHVSETDEVMEDELNGDTALVDQHEMEDQNGSTLPPPLARVTSSTNSSRIDAESPPYTHEDDDLEADSHPSTSQALDLTLPSSPSPPPQIDSVPPKFRQITLDTTNASWSRAATSASKTVNSSKSSKAGKSVASVVRHLSQYANPSQKASKNPYILDEAVEARGHGEEDEDEEDGEDVDNGFINDVEEESAEEGDGDEPAGSESDGENIDQLIDDSSTAAPRPSSSLPQPTEDDEDIIIVEKGKARACECPHETVVIDDGDEEEEDDLMIVDDIDREEQLAHLAELDAGSFDTTDVLSTPAEVTGLQLGADVMLPFDLAQVSSHWTLPDSPLPSTPASQSSSDQLAAAAVSESSESAEATLSRNVSKEDFGEMIIVGQFNLGFIITRRRVDGQDDLFIVDQHASDEKYNFETLQQETVMMSQSLLQPRTLHLPSHNEITAMDNVEMLKLNGFGVVVDEDAPVGERVKLAAQPVSKETAFGVEDFEELLDLINASASGEVVRPTKTRKMFASRACRKSVMIGKALNVNQMTSVVRHMGGMDQPWACPHGRPTMRWLAELTASRKEKRLKLSNLLQSYE